MEGKITLGKVPVQRKWRETEMMDRQKEEV